MIFTACQCGLLCRCHCCRLFIKFVPKAAPNNAHLLWSSYSYHSRHHICRHTGTVLNLPENGPCPVFVTALMSMLLIRAGADLDQLYILWSRQGRHQTQWSGALRSVASSQSEGCMGSSWPIRGEHIIRWPSGKKQTRERSLVFKDELNCSLEQTRLKCSCRSLIFTDCGVWMEHRDVWTLWALLTIIQAGLTYLH